MTTGVANTEFIISPLNSPTSIISILFSILPGRSLKSSRSTTKTPEPTVFEAAP